MNLLTEEWIPILLDGKRKRISLEILLTTENDLELTSIRDDMELATIQLLVSLVQVCFKPKDKTELNQFINTPLSSMEYKKSVDPYIEWFDLQHEKWPFMQVAGVEAQKGDKNFSSLHKLFIGLPEKTSTSPSSNAFFSRTDEIDKAHFGDVAVALFQQSTNGFSLGGSSFSVGLKGGMPVTTLILDRKLRKTIWLNILTKESWIQSKKVCDEPTWYAPPIHNVENSSNIGLFRGLFWQPSKIKLKIVSNAILGFYTTPGLCSANGFWFHPHTPLDIVRLKNNNPKEKPYQSLQRHKAIWGQMLCFFYNPNDTKQEEGISSALVVQQFKRYFKGNELNLGIGGYIKGGSAESLAWRKHETYSLSIGWEGRAGVMKGLIDIGNQFEQSLYFAVTRCCSYAFPTDKPDSITSPSLKQRFFDHSKKEFYKNSEPIFHSILKQISWDDEDTYSHFIQQLKYLVKSIYEETTASLNSDVKYFRGVAEGRKELNRKIKEIEDEN